MKKTLDVEKLLAEMTLEEKAQMCSGRDFWFTQDNERLGIPGVMMCDGPNGLRKQTGEGDHLGINESIETVCYPTASAFAASFDRELLEQLGELLGQECQAEHVAMLLGPGVNIKRSPLCGRNFEYFSEDPYLAGKLAASYIRGLQSQGVAACVKHFAANNQETRRMSGSSRVEERTLHEIYLPAFEDAVKEGHVRSVMCAYNAVNGTFCSENEELLNGILRRDWGFDGFVVTDWGATKRRPLGIKAGVDLEMPGSRQGKTEAILKALEEGTLTREELDQAVRNQLRFVREALENQKEDAVFDREAARRKAEEFAAECAVLLKNDGVLPLKKGSRVAFIGSFAEKPRYQGAGSSHINEKHPMAALDCTEGMQVSYARGYDASGGQMEEGSGSQMEDASGKQSEDAFGRPTENALLKEAVETARNADVAVIFAGLPESFETEGCDREHMRMPENQNVLIREIAKVQKNTVVVLHGGSPMELPWYDDSSERQAHIKRCGRPIPGCDSGGVEPFRNGRGSNRTGADRGIQSRREASRQRGKECGTDSHLLQPSQWLRMAPGGKHRLCGVCGYAPHPQIFLRPRSVLHGVCVQRPACRPGIRRFGGYRGNHGGDREYGESKRGRGRPTVSAGCICRNDPSGKGAGRV